MLSSQLNGLNERTTYSYDGEGRESLRQTANGVRVSTSYDNNGGVSLKQYWNSANAALAIYSGSYTRREQLSNQAELGTYPATYSYYANYQLGHDYRGSEQVNNYYDGVGNLSSRDNAGTTNYTYNSLNQLLTAVTGSVRTTLAYDLEGNMTSEIVGASYTTFSYDAMNRLVTVNKDGTSESYVYSADGLRQQKTAGGSTIDYVWDGQNVLVETNTSLVVQASYVDYPGMWGGLVSQNRSGTSNWYGFDLEGNTRILVSVGGVVTDSYSYRAFGEETAVRGTTVNAYRFGGVVGYYRDSATREYLRQRHYRSDLSRFMSSDPIGFAGGDVNLYRYVKNSPTNFGDPSGLDGFWDWYNGGMGGLSEGVDKWLMFGTTSAFGQKAGEYDSGQASGWDVLKAGGRWGGMLAVNGFLYEGAVIRSLTFPIYRFVGAGELAAMRTTGFIASNISKTQGCTRVTLTRIGQIKKYIEWLWKNDPEKAAKYPYLAATRLWKYDWKALLNTRSFAKAASEQLAKLGTRDSRESYQLAVDALERMRATGFKSVPYKELNTIKDNLLKGIGFRW